MKPLSVLANIKPGAEQQLTQILQAIDADLLNNPYMQLGKSSKTHFARFVIIHDPDPAVGARLLYYCDHDDNLYYYIEDLLAISPGLDALWGSCEDYHGREDFEWFIRSHKQDDLDAFVGFPSQGLSSVRAMIALREQLERFLSLRDVQLYLNDPGIKPLLDLLEQIAPSPSWLQRLWRQIRLVCFNIGDAFRQLALSASLIFAELYGRIGMNPNFSLVPEECADLASRQHYLQHQLDLENVENRFVQNQMTVYAEIKPGLYYQVRLRLAVFLAAYIITYGWPPGEFSGVYTIHSFNWLLLDHGRRLVFMSNFDSSAQNYLGDFLDHLSWGLNVFYNNCVGYPAGGMLQVDPFYQWIREHQIVPSVYYCAYPRETVLNMLRDQQIAKPFVQNIDPKALQAWLRML